MYDEFLYSVVFFTERNGECTVCLSSSIISEKLKDKVPANSFSLDTIRRSNTT